jgi:hypothetical protein
LYTAQTPSAPWSETLKLWSTKSFFKYLLLFVGTVVILALANPPFVQERRTEEHNDQEDVPCSFMRIFIVAIFITIIAVLVPFLTKHKDAISEWCTKVADWFKGFAKKD